jgi:hypothetical protein
VHKQVDFNIRLTGIICFPLRLLNIFSILAICEVICQWL